MVKLRKSPSRTTTSAGRPVRFTEEKYAKKTNPTGAKPPILTP
jgi:hypothetical protein